MQNKLAKSTSWRIRVSWSLAAGCAITCDISTHTWVTRQTDVLVFALALLFRPSCSLQKLFFASMARSRAESNNETEHSPECFLRYIYRVCSFLGPPCWPTWTVEKTQLAHRKLQLSYYAHVTRTTDCLEKAIRQGCVPGSRNKDDQEGIGESANGRDLGWTTHRGLQRTGTGGEVSYEPLTLQLRTAPSALEDCVILTYLLYSQPTCLHKYGALA